MSAFKFSGEAWKVNIFHQLVDRDKKVSSAKELIDQLHSLIERCESLQLENLQLGVLRLHGNSSSSSAPPPVSDNVQIQQLEQKIYKLQEELTTLHRTKGESAEQLLAVTNCLQERDKEVAQLKNKVSFLESEVMLLKEEKCSKEEKIKELTSLNTLLKDEYHALNLTFSTLEQEYQTLKKENNELVQRWLHYKSKDAERINQENDLYHRKQRQEVEAALREAVQESRTVVLPPEAAESAMAMATWACPFASVPTNAIYNKDCHDGDLTSIKISSTGKILASGGDDRNINIWNLTREGFFYGFTLKGSNAGINCLDFSHDDIHIAAASSDSASRIWSLADQRIRQTFTGHNGKVFACKFVSDGSKLVTGSKDRTIKIWDLKSRACFKTIFAGSTCHDVAVLSSSATIIFSGHMDASFRVYDLRSNNSDPNSVVKLEDKVTSVSLLNCSDNMCLVSCRDDVLRVVDSRKQAVVMEFSAEGLHLGCENTKACVSPNDEYCAVGSSDGSLYVWKMSNGVLQATLSGEHSSCVKACHWTPDGQMFLSAEQNKKVVAWACI